MTLPELKSQQPAPTGERSMKTIALTIAALSLSACCGTLPANEGDYVRSPGTEDTSGPPIETIVFATPDPSPYTPPSEAPAQGNASANNGKGGNYSHTGHADNGKGNGRGRRDD